MSLRDPAACHQRAQDHFDTAVLLDVDGSEWAAVAFFYSAYHRVRAAMLGDPVFDDMTRLKKLNPHLIPSDRLTERHKGRRAKGFVEFGLNDLVKLLYPQIYREYEALHQGSLQVRYQMGLIIEMDDIRAACNTVADASAAGELEA